MTEKEETKLRFAITFLGYKVIKFVVGLRVTQIPHICPDNPCCSRDGWIWLVPTPQPLWFAAYHFINVHPGSLQLVITYFTFPTVVEETSEKICFNHWSHHACFMSFATKDLVLNSARRAQAACKPGSCNKSAGTYAHDLLPSQIC